MSNRKAKRAKKPSKEEISLKSKKLLRLLSFRRFRRSYNKVPPNVRKVFNWDSLNQSAREKIRSMILEVGKFGLYGSYDEEIEEDLLTEYTTTRGLMMGEEGKGLDSKEVTYIDEQYYLVFNKYLWDCLGGLNDVDLARFKRIVDKNIKRKQGHEGKRFTYPVWDYKFDEDLFFMKKGPCIFSVGKKIQEGDASMTFDEKLHAHGVCAVSKRYVRETSGTVTRFGYVKKGSYFMFNFPGVSDRNVERKAGRWCNVTIEVEEESNETTYLNDLYSPRIFKISVVEYDHSKELETTYECSGTKTSSAAEGRARNFPPYLFKFSSVVGWEWRFTSKFNLFLTCSNDLCWNLKENMKMSGTKRKAGEHQAGCDEIRPIDKKTKLD